MKIRTIILFCLGVLSIIIFLLIRESAKNPEEKTVVIEKRKPIPVLTKEREVKDLKQNVKKEIPTSINSKYIGTFSIYLETEETMTGMASIDYTFSITNEFIQLKTNTYHQPILCNGTYKAVEKNHILELYYIGKDEFCDTVNPMFFLREEGGELYAKGLGGEGTYHNWIELKRI